MKSILSSLAFAALICAACTQGEPCSEQLLSDGWKLSSGDITVNATVPSTVMGALRESGRYADILEAQNYDEADKTIFDQPWTYSLKFKASQPAGSHSELVFDGLNYYADIVLNGVKIASSDTTFGTFNVRRYDVTDILKASNMLEVTVSRAQSGDLNLGFVDWNPRPLDENMGIFREVRLITNAGVAVKDTYVATDLDLDGYKTADVKVSTFLTNMSGKDVNVEVKAKVEDNEFGGQFQLAAGEAKTVCLDPLRINNPRVWWCQGLGDPEMYELDMDVYVDGVKTASQTVPFGVRTITSKLDDEHFRTFTLNGKDVLIKGAGWTDDIFLQDTHESLERQIRYVKDMNMNLVRFEGFWGKDQYVYDLCDRYGLLAMVGFSCQWEWEDYCGLPESDYGCINSEKDIKLAASYFEDMVKWLRNHPAIICWVSGSDRFPTPELESKYLSMLDQCDYRPYVNSAKNLYSQLSGWSGTKMEGPYEYVGPSYWYTDTEAGGAFGFNTETGIGAQLPLLESAKKFIPEDELWPMGPSWNAHCTHSSSAMNKLDVLTNIINNKYGEADNLEDYLNRAYAVDYDGTRAMFEAFRVNIPRATGIVQWMLNSAWPSLYWQMYDWYGVPVASYYSVKNACEPVQLIYNYGDRNVYAVNETGAAVTVNAKIDVYDADSKSVCSIEKSIEVADRAPVKVADLTKELSGSGHFLFLSLDATGKTAHNYYAIPAKEDTFNFNKTNWYITPITEYADLSFVSALADAEVEMSESRETKDGKTVITVTLENKSDVVAYQYILTAKDAAGEIIVPSFWSDNFVSIAPHKSMTLTCTLDGNVDAKVEIRGLN